MGQCESSNTGDMNEIWIIDSNKEPTNDIPDVKIKALMRTLHNMGNICKKETKVYISCSYDTKLIQPMIDHCPLIPVSTTHGTFNELFSLMSQSSSNRSNKTQTSNTDKYSQPGRHDLIYIILAGDVPINPSMELERGVGCKLGYYEDDNNLNFTLSGSVVKRHIMDLVLKSFFAMGQIQTNPSLIVDVKRCLFELSSGRTGLQKMIKYDDKVTDFASLKLLLSMKYKKN